MAEGDKFERRLRGFGWRKVYQLGKSSAAMPKVVDATITAISCGLRNELKCTRLADILGLLEFSLQADWRRQQAGKSDPNEPSPHSCLSVELERIQADELYSISVQLASTAAGVCFCRY